MPFPRLAPLDPETPDYEHLEQARFFDLLSHINPKACPAAALTFAVPNQAVAKFRILKMRVRFWKEGVRAGVPDILCLQPSAPYHGLAIEMKRPGEKPRPEQRDWHRRLEQAGYCVAVCLSAQEAFRAWCDYLGIQPAP